MGRYIGPKNKIARRFGVNLGLKTNATKVARRIKQAPGVHGPNKRQGQLSTFGKQLAEKQKAKFLYGIRERQFHAYMKLAEKYEGNSGTNLQRILERRFDNVIYRLGFASTRAQARQMVGHGMFTLNGKKMNIPSHLVKVGDVIELKKNKEKKKLFENVVETLEKHQLPSWLKTEPKEKRGTVVGQPEQVDFERVFDVTLIIEYYSTR